MAKTETLTCIECGSPWERERKRGARPKYCSPKCKQRHRNPEKWKKLTCTVCGAGWNWKVRGGATPKACSEKCRKQYCADKSQAWRDQHPERYLEHAQNTRKKNREVINSRNRKKRALYPEIFRQYDLTKRRRHPEAIRLRFKRYRAENRDSLMRANREWREKNKGRIQANNLRRKAVIRGAFVEDVDKEVLLERDGWTCHICKGEIPKGLARAHPLFPHIEHIVPLSKGGEHSYGNTAPAHASCNLQKGSMLDGWQNIKPIISEEGPHV